MLGERRQVIHSILILPVRLWQLGHRAAKNSKATCALRRMEVWTGIEVSGKGEGKSISRENKEFQRLGVERQLSGWAGLLLFQRTWSQFPTPLTSTCNPAPRVPMHCSSKLCRHCPHVCLPLHRYTYTHTIKDKTNHFSFYWKYIFPM